MPARRVAEQLMDLTKGGASMWWSTMSRHRDLGGGRQGARQARPPGHARRRQRRQDVQPFGGGSANKEQDILGSRYVTRAEVLKSLDLVARGEVFPLVTVVRPLEEAEAVHDLVERGEVIGRAALRVA